MSKTILICGKICSGKSTYAYKLAEEIGGVVLSVDEVMLCIFGPDCGNMHDVYAEKTKEFLLKKSLELVDAGINVILDWGFWTKSSRINTKKFYCERRIECEIHFIDIKDELWRSRISARNESVANGETQAYYIDSGLAAKFESIFVMPEPNEIDVWVREEH